MREENKALTKNLQRVVWNHSSLRPWKPEKSSSHCVLKWDFQGFQAILDECMPGRWVLEGIQVYIVDSYYLSLVFTLCNCFRTKCIVYSLLFSASQIRPLDSLNMEKSQIDFLDTLRSWADKFHLDRLTRKWCIHLLDCVALHLWLGGCCGLTCVWPSDVQIMSLQAHFHVVGMLWFMSKTDT